MVIDDDPDMLWFMSELFASEYNVIPVDNSGDARNIISGTHPNVIICDMTMTDGDGMAIARMIKSDSRISHVPLVLISSKRNIETQIEGFEAGAEMYVTKPFSDDYLKTVVRHLISRKETLKDYFSSPISAYELTDGKFTHIDHRRFVQQMLDVVNSNIGDKGLSAGFIASKLNMSTRHLYRRIAEAGAQSPLEMIRECRLHIAIDLLRNSRLTIDEIIYKSGFSNRGPFFKAFADKYGCTPGVFRERISSHNMK